MPIITAFMGQDHDRLDELFRQFQVMKNQDPHRAKALFSEFKQGLQRHIVWEEKILFPLFDAHTGIGNGGPTTVMRSEHRRIGEVLELIHDRIAQGSLDTIAFESGLIDLLAGHNKKEEFVLYPCLDQSLTGPEIQAALAGMKAMPEERYHHCCGKGAAGETP